MMCYLYVRVNEKQTCLSGLTCRGDNSLTLSLVSTFKIYAQPQIPVTL